MNAADNPQIEVLMSASARDEGVLPFPVADEIFGFHAQQAIEKLYKALVSMHGEEFPFTHNLERLADQLSKLGEHLPELPLSHVALNEYAVQVRYEAGAPISVQMRQDLRAAISALRIFITDRGKRLCCAGKQVRKP